MIVSSKSNEAKWAMHAFLQVHGVEIWRSEDFQAVGQLSLATKELIGVVGYNGFTGRTCMMHVAGIGNWITRELLFAAFDYPFTQCDIEHIIGPVAANNHRALRFNKHLGFEVLHRLRDGFEHGVDLVVMRMARHQCRWLVKLERKHELQAA